MKNNKLILIAYTLLVLAGCENNNNGITNGLGIGNERFEINLVNLTNLYESGSSYNCILIQTSDGEKVYDKRGYILIKGYKRFEHSRPLILGIVSIHLDDTITHYHWYIKPDGEIIPRFKIKSYPYPVPQMKESKVIFSCIETDIDDSIFMPPKGIDFEDVSKRFTR